MQGKKVKKSRLGVDRFKMLCYYSMILYKLGGIMSQMGDVNEYRGETYRGNAGTPNKYKSTALSQNATGVCTFPGSPKNTLSFILPLQAMILVNKPNNYKGGMYANISYISFMYRLPIHKQWERFRAGSSINRND
jgi:hypothetical protein